MKKTIYTIIIPILLIFNISASKIEIKIISDQNIINAITKDLPEENKIKEFLKKIIKNPEAIEIIKQATKNNIEVVTYLTKIQLFKKLIQEKVVKMSKKGIRNISYATKWALNIIKANKIKSGIILTSTGLIITAYLLKDNNIAKECYRESEYVINICTEFLEKQIVNSFDFIKNFRSNKESTSTIIQKFPAIDSNISI